ncbi:MAG: polysaccharide pyruvyl transferase family protein [Methanophagales archaeon]|nr:polysaccharide pyruvyl transferase family protein [Methanophagales archaeon]
MASIHTEEVKMGKVYKIFIAENVPSLNKGEMTILEGMLESFKNLGKVEVTMLSDLPQIDQSRYETKVKIIDLKKALGLSGELSRYNELFRIFASLLFISHHLLFLILYKIFGSRTLKLMKSEIWEQYVESDVIIVGHNGAFGLGWGGMFKTPVYLYYFYMPLFANMLGKPIVLYGGSIPRFRRFRWIFERGAKFALNRINLITLREDVSYQNLRELGVKNNRVFVIPDLAFLLRPVPSDEAKKIMVREGIEETNRPFIGMTITRDMASMAFPDLNSPESSYHKHIEMLAQVIDNLTSMLNATVIFIPHCIGFAKELDDRIVAGDIFQRCKNKDKVKVITNEYGAAELKGIIGQFDLFIGVRTHSVVNAMSMCVPSIVISYSTDQRLGIIKMIGQEKAICYVENLNAETLLSKISDIWSERNKIKKDLKSQTEIIRERAMLNGKLLKELL